MPFPTAAGGNLLGGGANQGRALFAHKLARRSVEWFDFHHDQSQTRVFLMA